MISFISAILCLIVGYLLYGKMVDRVFGSDPNRKTPCYSCQDGVDYIPMPTWKVYMIQFLNIAGTGPIFGAIQGILFGPAAFFWIVLGCIFGGAVHDYMSGMISIRMKGASLPEIIGDNLGNIPRLLMRVVSVVLMILVGAVFVTTPADLLSTMVPNNGYLFSKEFWITIIFAYYILATLMPIDKIIGAIYPLFGIALLIMAAGLGFGIFTEAGNVPEITDAFVNHHPKSTMPLFPGLFITIACGAVSGFHGTQSPMMARCLKNEKYGRPIFYGAMITEGLVALIWAAAAIKFADSLDVAGNTPYEKLLNAMTIPETGKISPALLVNKVCNSWLGSAGAILAVLGVVAAPVTSGDTAFRSARLIAADFLHYKQNKVYKRILLSLPLFVGSAILMMINFDVLWRYFAWVNQTLAVFTLWAITIWLSLRCKREGHSKFEILIGLIPALWMTIICTSYILIAPEGFGMHHDYAYTITGIVVIGFFVSFLSWYKRI